MAAETTKVFIACDIKNGLGAARRSDAIEGARRWCRVLGTVFANLWTGKQSVQPTAWANIQEATDPSQSRDGLLQGAMRGAGRLRAGLNGGHDGIRG